jgi:ABC-type multidrug transport system ATPase subunit
VTDLLLAGLDVENRLKILELVKELHAAKKPRIIMGLRVQDEIPDWITHIAFADKGKVRVGGKEEISRSLQQHVTMEHGDAAQVNRPTVRDQGSEGRVVVAIEGANVQYGERKVCAYIYVTCMP